MDSIHKLAFHHGKYYNNIDAGKRSNRYSTTIPNELYVKENKDEKSHNVIKVCCIFFQYNNDTDYYYLSRCVDSISIQSSNFSQIYIIQYMSNRTLNHFQINELKEKKYIFFKNNKEEKKIMNINIVTHLYKNNISFAKNSILYILAETFLGFGNSKLIQINMTNYKCLFTCDWNEKMSSELASNKYSIIVGKIIADQTWIKNMLYYSHSDFLDVFYKNKCNNQSKFVYSENMCFYLQNIYKFVWWNTFIENEEMSDICFSNLLQDKKIGIPVKCCETAIVVFTFNNNFYKYFFNIGKNYHENYLCLSN